MTYIKYSSDAINTHFWLTEVHQNRAIPLSRIFKQLAYCQLFEAYSQRSYFAFTTGNNISMDGVGYLAAREPLFPLFPALTWLALRIKKREEDEKGRSNGRADSTRRRRGGQASASKRTDEIQTRDNFLTLLLADRPANRFSLPPFPRSAPFSHPSLIGNFASWIFIRLVGIGGASPATPSFLNYPRD